MSAFAKPTDWWGRIATTVIAGLLLAGVSALFYMGSALTRLEERVANWSQVFEKRIDGFESKYDRKFDRFDDVLRDLQKRSQLSPPASRP